MILEIKEVEKLLSISRSNIRFYEKKGLLSPERRDNNYRDYDEEDILALKKTVVLRKMGFSVEEILLIQNGELSFTDAIPNTRERLETEIEELQGSLKVIDKVAKECSSFDEIDVDRYWESIHMAEESGEKFIDICKDYLYIELELIDNVCNYIFFHDFKDSRKKRGVLKACLILLAVCILRGIGRVVIWKESFWVGFLYPWQLALSVTIIGFPLYVLSRKVPKVAELIIIAFSCLIIAFLLFMLFVLGYIVFGFIRSILF